MAEALGVAKQVKSFQERVREAGDEKPEDAFEIDPEVKKRKEEAQEDGLAAIWEEGEEESTVDWLNGGGLAFGDKAHKLAGGKAKETLEIFDPLAAAGDEVLLERARQRRSDQLKPSLRRSTDLQKW